MPQYEYRVISAPTRGVKSKGITSNEARFAHALEDTMNTMARDGWEYQRAETLPSVERTGVSDRSTIWRNVLVFRRAVPGSDTRSTSGANDILRLTNPIISQEPPAISQINKAVLPKIVTPQHPDDDASQSQGASRMLVDNGVEELSEVSGISNSLKQLAESRKRARSAS